MERSDAQCRRLAGEHQPTMSPRPRWQLVSTWRAWFRMSGSVEQSGTSRARGHRLSVRLLWLTVTIVLVTEVLVFVPGLGSERHHWLLDRITQAHIAALSVAAARDGTVDTATRNELLRLSGTAEIRVREPNRIPLILQPSGPVVPAASIDLRNESRLTGMVRALRELATTRDRLLQVTATSPYRPRADVEIVINERALGDALRKFARTFAWFSVFLAGVTGSLVYVAVSILLVRPIRRIIGSIAAFRADPERAALFEPARSSRGLTDELAAAGHELAAMQQELRTALLRNARLAVLGTSLAKVSHDLRGILSPALLAADRLQFHADAAVRRAGEIVVAAVERATTLVSETLEFARQGPSAPAIAEIALARLVDEAAEAIALSGAPLGLDNRVDSGLTIAADRNQLFRVLVNLLRNAAEAGATCARVEANTNVGVVAIDIADNGPGLTEAVRANLFRPFSSGKRGGTGLGLSIARELMRAHGGDIELVCTGPEGATFRLTLPVAPRRGDPGPSTPSSRPVAPAQPHA
jgi:signal transduction histidine kinase